MSLVEVLVAFAMLLLLVAAFSRTVVFAGRATQQADETRAAAAALVEAYYLGETSSDPLPTKLVIVDDKKGTKIAIDTTIYEYAGTGASEGGVLYSFGKHELSQGAGS